MELKTIGKVVTTERGFGIELRKEYRDGLTNIRGFSHINILWWADKTAEYAYEMGLVIKRPYTKGPETIGVFATRSQIRPNPIGVSIVSVEDIDQEKGIIYTYYIDAFPETSVLDIKPYHPSTDLVKNCSVPEWCSHWPDSVEGSATFNWEEEFNF